MKMKEDFEQVENILHTSLDEIVQERLCRFCLGKLLFRKGFLNMVKCTRQGCRKEFSLIKDKPFFNTKCGATPSFHPIRMTTYKIF